MASARRRIGTALLAAGIGVLATGTAALPVSAQNVAVPPDQGGVYAAPPPYDGAQPPADGGGKPSTNYKKKNECVVQEKLNNNVVLKNKPWGQQYLRVDEVHKLMRAESPSHTIGGGITVAVIDTGVTKHPYLQDRVVGGGDYVKPDTMAGPGLEDCDGHGTEVAGIIAANPTDPEIGFKGMAPDARILSIRQSSQNYTKDTSTSTAPPPSSGAPGESPAPGPSGQPAPSGQPTPSQSAPPGTQLPPSQSNGTTQGQSVSAVPQQGQPTGNGGRQLGEEGNAGDLSTLGQAIMLAVNQGAQVINMSVDSCRKADGRISEAEKSVQAAVHYAMEKNVVVIAAAGNTSQDCEQNNQTDPNLPKSIVTPPWFSEDVLSVAAVDETGGVAQFSVHGPWVGVAAPGTDITSLDPAAGATQLANLTYENGQPTGIQGTSFAAPYVSGLAALVRAKYPNLNARQVVNRITSTAQHPASGTGRDTFVGYGVINPIAALTATIPSELGIPPAQSVALPSDMPPLENPNSTPMLVALIGAGGGLVALLVTLFTVHTIRRKRTTPEPRRVA